jgi:hypothetical protein
MLKPITPIAANVSFGRKRLTRQVVLTSLAGIACYAYRREVIPYEADRTRDESIFPDGIVLSSEDHHATRYTEAGYATVMFDHFTGGSMQNDFDDINAGEAMMQAQIEPFKLEHYESQDFDQLIDDAPEWTPKKGDLFALVVADGLIKWMECIGVSGQSLHAQHGTRYMLNVRDRLTHLEPFISIENALLPESNPFPLPLIKLNYSEIPYFSHVKNAESDLSDDVVTEKQFKLVSITDPQVATYPEVENLITMSRRTSSSYYFNTEDAEIITVNTEPAEKYILSAETAVKAIDADTHHFTNILVMTDNEELVNTITARMDSYRNVHVICGQRSVQLSRANFDAERKAFYFVIQVNLESNNRIQLQADEEEISVLEVDLTQLKPEI